MSKMDGLRAMREARYEQMTKGARPAPATRPKVAPSPKTAAAAPEAATEALDEAAGALCGHRNMGGRTCTREQGHAAKSHRYS